MSACLEGTLQRTKKGPKNQSQKKSKPNFPVSLFLEKHFRMNQMLGNIDAIREYHENVILPMMEKAVGDSKIMR